MLTAPDQSGQGQVRFVPDPELPELTSFFHERRESANRRVSEMPWYLGRRGHRVCSYRDDDDDFTTFTRKAYFAGIPDEALRHSVVFFDPDNGMEPQGRATERHLLYSELEQVYLRMDEVSVAVVFQYFRRVPDFWDGFGAALRDRLRADVLFVVEPAVGFYVVAKDASRIQTLEAALDGVATRHTPHGRGRRRVGRALQSQ